MVSMAKIYILCVANLRSGGPDALHQLRYYLDKAGFDAYIVYFGTTDGVEPMPEVYSVYGIKRKLLSEIEDKKENILISAESSTVMLNGYKHIRKYIWWLSVNWFDYNKLTYKNRLKHQLKKLLKKESDISTFCDFSLNDCIHVCGSKYAYEYALKIGIKQPQYMVEPISKVFLEVDNNSNYERDNVILYNPAKPSDIMSKLLENGNYKFKALTKMTPEELIEAYKHAKLYVDFGHFGGPERMPKEAVYFGCCILVGKRNAAENDFDIAIPEKYKILDYNNMDVVSSKIEQILLSYNECIDDFNSFRLKVSMLEDNFLKQITNIFSK